MAKSDSSQKLKNQFLSRAYLGLGRIFELKAEKDQSLNSYKKAYELGAKLPENAIVLLANFYVVENERSTKAINLYMSYIKIKSEYHNDPIYTFLHKLCSGIKFHQLSKEEKNNIIDLNKKIIQTRPNLFWPYFNLGVINFYKKDIESAKSFLQKVIELNPDYGLSYYWLGRIQLNDENISEAQNSFNTFLNLSENNEQLNIERESSFFELGKIHLKNIKINFTKIDLKDESCVNEINLAIKYFKNAIHLNQNNSEYYVKLAMAFYLITDYEKAILNYKNAIKLSPKEFTYYYDLSKVYLELNKLGSTEQLLLKSIELNKNYTKAYKLLARVQIKRNKFNEAEKVCYQAIQIDNKDKQTYKILIEALYKQNKFRKIIKEVEKNKDIIIKLKTSPEIIFYIARSYSQMDELKTSLEYYQKLLDKPKYLYYLGCTLALLKKYDEALKYFKELAKVRNPYTQKAIIQRGHIYYIIKNITKAKEEYNFAFQQNPKDVETIHALGQFYFNLDDLQNAKKFFQEAIAINKNYSYAHYGIGLIDEKNNQLEKALEHYTTALNNAPNSLENLLHFRIGIILCLQEKYEHALPHLKKVSLAGNDSDSFLYYYGFALLFNDQLKNAIDVWNKLYSRHTDNYRLFVNILRAKYLLGKKYIEHGKYDEAIIIWEDYIKNYSEDKKTIDSIAELYFREAINFIKEKKDNYIENARLYLKKAINLNDQSLIYKFYLAICEYKLGNFKESLSLLNHLLAIQPTNKTYLYHKGLLLLQLENKKNEAMEILNNLSQNDHTSLSQWANWIIANEQIKNQNFNEAINKLRVLL